MAKFVVGPVESLPPGTRQHVEIDGRGVAVFNVAGRYFALRDVCPHQGARLSDGVVMGEVKARRAGAYCFTPGKHIRCPWHGWEYDLETGQSSYDPQHDRVRAYEVTVEHGAALRAAERVPGPYTAETVPISVEDDYVVLEV